MSYCSKFLQFNGFKVTFQLEDAHLESIQFLSEEKANNTDMVNKTIHIFFFVHHRRGEEEEEGHFYSTTPLLVTRGSNVTPSLVAARIS